MVMEQNKTKSPSLQKGRNAAEMSKKRMVAFPDEKAAMVVEWRRWEGLNPELLALIFVRMTALEMVRCVPFVCKPWMEVVAGPYCWRDIDVQAWCRRRNDSHAVDLVVKKLIRRSKWTVQRLSAFRLGESGFFFVANCGRCLKVLQIPMSGITDHMIMKYLRQLPNLTFLDISHCSKITAKGLETFGKECKSLIHLKRNMPPLDACSPVDDSEAKTIAQTMMNLQCIELRFGQFGDSGLSEILTKCKSLTHLDIQGSWNVELHAGLEEICEKLEHFQSPYDDEFLESEGSDIDSASGSD